MNKIFQTLLVSALVFGAAAAEMPRIFMAGDSTMCDRKTTVKMAGWGQLLRKYVKDGVVIGICIAAMNFLFYRKETVQMLKKVFKRKR